MPLQWLLLDSDIRQIERHECALPHFVGPLCMPGQL
jgi:hypothetical protein